MLCAKKCLELLLNLWVLINLVTKFETILEEKLFSLSLLGQRKYWKWGLDKNYVGLFELKMEVYGRLLIFICFKWIGLGFNCSYTNISFGYSL